MKQTKWIFQLQTSKYISCHLEIKRILYYSANFSPYLKGTVHQMYSMLFRSLVAPREDVWYRFHGSERSNLAKKRKKRVFKKCTMVTLSSARGDF